MKKALPILLLLVASVAFCVGLLRLFKLRYEAGDVYPEYSSLRADPLGTMVFYESLERMPGISARRDFSAGNRLPPARNTAYFHLAAARADWASLPEDLFHEIDSFLLNGGRLVVTFFPDTSWRARTPLPPFKSTPSAKKSGKKAAAETESEIPRVHLKDKWNVELGFVPLERDAHDAPIPARVINQTGLPLPDWLAWHSGTVLTNLGESWQTIYARGTNAVLAERRFGAGTVVLATDSFFLSNEALRQDRHADLLAWLVGGGHEVFFDEAHFGIVENPGVTTLMRRYRLHGLVLGLLALAGLFVWQHVSSFAPTYGEEQESELVAGKDAASGFVNLLRRSVSPPSLLGVCFDEWTKSLLHGTSIPISRVDQAQTRLEAENARAQTERDPVAAYNDIARALKTRL